MTDKFTKPMLRNIRMTLQEVLDAECKTDKIPFKFTLGNCTFEEDQAKFQLIVTFKGTTPQDIQRKKEYEDLQQMAKFFDIDLLKKHPRYTLVGYKSKARTKPWIITDNQRSGEFIITDDQAKTLFGKKDVNEFIERQREAQSNA
jgi:hypothetical protein|tara:strand:+ start:6242 stop:6676 length:435 start_codon:yes stop_codon:yes gene_type:complete